MNKPPEYLLPFLISIENTVLRTYKEFPSLVDKEIEGVYEKLANYYKKLASKKSIDEPLFPSERKQVLSDEILNLIDTREEEEADIDLINNPAILQGLHTIPSLPHLYATAFKRLQKSAAYWRKKNGAKGYLNYISDFIKH